MDPDHQPVTPPGDLPAPRSGGVQPERALPTVDDLREMAADLDDVDEVLRRLDSASEPELGPVLGQ